MIKHGLLDSWVSDTLNGAHPIRTSLLYVGSPMYYTQGNIDAIHTSRRLSYNNLILSTRPSSSVRPPPWFSGYVTGLSNGRYEVRVACANWSDPKLDALFSSEPCWQM